MSRVGNKPIALPQGVEIKINGTTVDVKGAKGTLSREIDADFAVALEDGALTVKRPTDQKRHKALHGLYRSLLNNMVIGVSEGYQKKLELVGVGYKAAIQGQILEMNLGYSHNIFMEIPKEVKAQAETLKGKNPTVTLDSIDKELVGEVAAKIRSLRKVEPYKGKGVRFVGEIVRRKAGKTAAK
ncbi:MAG: 50S ribosomal protein L6 [Reichenbachiella sp.]